MGIIGEGLPGGGLFFMRRGRGRGQEEGEGLKSAFITEF